MALRSFADLGEAVLSRGDGIDGRGRFFAEIAELHVKGSYFVGDDRDLLLGAAVELWECCVAWLGKRPQLDCWIEFPELVECGSDFIAWRHYAGGHSIKTYFDRPELELEPSLAIMRSVARFFFELPVHPDWYQARDGQFVADLLKPALLEDSSFMFGPVPENEWRASRWRLRSPSAFFSTDVLHAWANRHDAS